MDMKDKEGVGGMFISLNLMDKGFKVDEQAGCWMQAVYDLTERGPKHVRRYCLLKDEIGN